jgi:hypothetical protein
MASTAVQRRSAARKAMATKRAKNGKNSKGVKKAFAEMTENELLCRRVKLGKGKYIRSSSCTGQRKVVQRNPSTGQFIKKDDSIIFTKSNKKRKKKAA